MAYTYEDYEAGPKIPKQTCRVAKSCANTKEKAVVHDINTESMLITDDAPWITVSRIKSENKEQSDGVIKALSYSSLLWQ